MEAESVLGVSLCLWRRPDRASVQEQVRAGLVKLTLFNNFQASQRGASQQLESESGFIYPELERSGGQCLLL